MDAPPSLSSDALAPQPRHVVCHGSSEFFDNARADESIPQRTNERTPTHGQLGLDS